MKSYMHLVKVFNLIHNKKLRLSYKNQQALVDACIEAANISYDMGYKAGEFNGFYFKQADNMFLPRFVYAPVAPIEDDGVHNPYDGPIQFKNG